MIDMERKRTISEDAILKTQHLLTTINLKIVKGEFPFSVYKLAQEKRIGNNAVRAMFALGIVQHEGNNHSGRFTWHHEGHPDRTLAVKVMNQALAFRGLTESGQSSMQEITGERFTTSVAPSATDKLKYFKQHNLKPQQPTLFSSSDEKLNHAIQIAAGIAAGYYSDPSVNIKNYESANDGIAEATKDLLNKLYQIKF